MKRVLVLLAPGAEEMEAVIVTDVLRRGGLDVTLAGIEDSAPVSCSRGVKLVPDLALADTQGSFDLIVLPGGAAGAKALAESPTVQELLRRQDREGRLIGAICAAPIALVSAGVGKGKALTSHPSVRAALAGFGDYREKRVVRDGNLVTSRGPGTALEFALTLVEILSGGKKAREVGAPMILPE